jgi:hypothetical protein
MCTSKTAAFPRHVTPALVIVPGNSLFFLDADDWFFPGALAVNCAYLLQHSEAAFVSGAHQKINQHYEVIEEVKMPVDDNHYLHLLQGNYIGMHATVMYRRFVLKSCVSMFRSKLARTMIYT